VVAIKAAAALHIDPIALEQVVMSIQAEVFGVHGERECPPTDDAPGRNARHVSENQSKAESRALTDVCPASYADLWDRASRPEIFLGAAMSAKRRHLPSTSRKILAVH
jgi:hypothetical protein